MDDRKNERAGPLERDLRERLDRVCAEGRELWAHFDSEVRKRAFHPFVAADYGAVLEALVRLRAPGRRFLEWGSANGVVTIMADLLGFDADGIEIDRELVGQARDLARRSGSTARFTEGSFLPTGYEWRDPDGDGRLGTIERGASGYDTLGVPLGAFEVVFGYPWAGEEPMMLDLMRRRGRSGARLLIYNANGIEVHRDGRRVAA